MYVYKQGVLFEIQMKLIGYSGFCYTFTKENSFVRFIKMLLLFVNVCREMSCGVGECVS